MPEFNLIENMPRILTFAPDDAVGYWVLAKNDKYGVRIGMVTKPSQTQIDNTRELIGWEWEDK